MNISERIQIIDQALLNYENSLSLPPSEPPGLANELQEYLKMERDYIEKLDSEKCKSIAYRLAQFAFYLQREINRENAKLKWAEETIYEFIADKVGSYDKYMKHELKLVAIAKEDESVAKLLRLRKEACQRVERLNGLADNLKYMAGVIRWTQKN